MQGYKWYTIVLLLILVVFQPYIYDWFAIGGSSMNFVLFFIMLSAFSKKKPDIFIVPLIVGIFYDLLYSPWIGRMTIVLLISVVVVFLVRDFVYRANVFIFTAFFFVVTYLLENLKAFLEVGLSFYLKSFSFFQGNILRLSIYAGAISAIFGLYYFLTSLSFEKKIKRNEIKGEKIE